MDTMVHPAGGYTIPNTDTYLYYLTNNPTGSGGGVGILTLPAATVSGRRLIAIPANPSGNGSSNRLQLNAASGDTIYDESSTPLSSLVARGPVMVHSDGNHHWYVIATQ